MLNNRWLVVALAGIAVLMVLSNVVRPLLEAREEARLVRGTPDVDVENELTGTGIDTTEQGAQFDSAQGAISSIEVAALHWDERPQRDPFRPVAVVSDAALDAVAAVVANTPTAGRKIRWPDVSAVVDSRQQQYAIIGGEIRRPGDRFTDFQLVNIEKQTVELAHAPSRSVRRVKVTTK